MAGVGPSALHQLELAPTIFQELVKGPTDIRATIIGEEIYAAAIHTEQSRVGLDSRLDLDVPMTPYEMPRDTALRLRALMVKLNLRFATVDLKLDDSGRLHFLELNPQGQFLYVEILTGQPIAAAMARMLVNANQGPSGARAKPATVDASTRTRARARDYCGTPRADPGGGAT